MKECPEAPSTRWVGQGCPRSTGNPALSAPSHVTTSPNTREPLEGARGASVPPAVPQGVCGQADVQSPLELLFLGQSRSCISPPPTKTPVHRG